MPQILLVGFEHTALIKETILESCSCRNKNINQLNRKELLLLICAEINALDPKNTCGKMECLLDESNYNEMSFCNVLRLCNHRRNAIELPMSGSVC